MLGALNPYRSLYDKWITLHLSAHTHTTHNSTFLLNATSKDEREAWIEAIKNNIPHSPKTARKEDTKPKDCVTSTQETERTRPKYINRQDTVDTAAVLVAGAADDDDNEVGRCV